MSQGNDTTYSTNITQNSNKVYCTFSYNNPTRNKFFSDFVCDIIILPTFVFYEAVYKSKYLFRTCSADSGVPVLRITVNGAITSKEKRYNRSNKFSSLKPC